MKIDKSESPALQQSKRASLRADFSWMFVGNAVYAAGQFATLMLFTKLVRPEFVGQYALALALVYPVILLTNLQLRAVMTSGARPRTGFGHFLCLRLLMTVLAMLIIFVITRILNYPPDLTAVILMVGFAYALDAISDVYYAQLQLHDRLAENAKSLMARSLLAVLGLAVATFFTRNIFWGVAAIALARAIVLFSYDIRKRTHGQLENSDSPGEIQVSPPHFNLRVQRELLWLSFPLGIVVLLSTLNSSIPAYFIKNALGERELGIFAAIGFMVSVGNMVVVSLGQSAFTRLARSYVAGDFPLFVSLLGMLLAVAAGITVCGMIVSQFEGRAILTFLFRREYAERADLLPWIMAAGGIVYLAQFLGFGLTAAGFYYSQVALNILANVSLVIACYRLVASQGLLGVIYAMLAAGIVQFAASAAILAFAMRTQVSARTERVEPA